MNALEIRKFREEFGLTQTQLAEILGTSVRAVQSWEQGVRNITEGSAKLLEVYRNKHNVSPHESTEQKASSPELEYVSKEERLLRIIESQQKTIEKLTELMSQKKQDVYMDARAAGAG